MWIKTTKQGDTQAEFYYYQNDHLGTPQQILDAQGNLVWRQQATAFGETQPTSSPTRKPARSAIVLGDFILMKMSYPLPE